MERPRNDPNGRCEVARCETPGEDCWSNDDRLTADGDLENAIGEIERETDRILDTAAVVVAVVRDCVIEERRVCVVFDDTVRDHCDCVAGVSVVVVAIVADFPEKDESVVVVVVVE